MEITTYTSSDGTVTPIAELNNFHLLNALCKVSSKIGKPEAGMANDIAEADARDLQSALKAEVLKRLAPPQA